MLLRYPLIGEGAIAVWKLNCYAYANFCRITGTPEELIIDFGLNPQPFGVPAAPLPVSQQIVMDYYTVKRPKQALQITVKGHEATFGILETDVQKRAELNRPGGGLGYRERKR